MMMKVNRKMTDDNRCPWANTGHHQLYKDYHDHEWGVPEYDDRTLWEKLILDGAQAGLSWWTILKKRENYRQAFDQFDPTKIAKYDEQKIASLMQDAGIVRNRLKIHAAVLNAQQYLKIMEKRSFSEYIWNHVDGRPIVNELKHSDEIIVTSPISDRLSKQLKKDGFKFVGSTIVYAFMQAVGMVNDHLVTCPRHKELQLTNNN